MAGDSGGQFSPGARAELAQGARHVILDGARAYPEAGRDLGIGEAAGDQIRDVALRGGET